LDLQSTANLVENNIFSVVDGGGIMASGGAIGNVLGYNYLPDIRFDEAHWMIAGPSPNHSAHPSMNLWEGNIGPQIGADFIHGSSSHQVFFRCRSTGWKSATQTDNNNAIDFQHKNTYMSVLGCILGTAGQSDTYEVAYPAAGSYALKTIWRLGYGGPNGAGDPNVKATLLRHGNFDYVSNSTRWDPAISDHNLPASLYLSGKPAWWGTTPFPPIGPDVSGLTNKIPAQERFERTPPPPLPTVTVAATGASASESGTDQGTFTITLTGSTTAAITVNFSVSGTATNGSDFMALGTSVTIAAGAASATVTVTPVDDTVAESNETVILTIAANAAYSIGTPSNATVTIADNDTQPPTLPTVAVAATDAAAAEPSNNGMFTFTRTGSTTAALTVNFSVSGTATSGSDYTALGTSVTIPAGAASVNKSVTSIDNTVVESIETVIVAIASNAAYTIGSPASATVTIADNDNTAPVIVSAASATPQRSWVRLYRSVSRPATRMAMRSLIAGRSAMAVVARAVR
jgi:hypothetical protein